MMEKLERKKPKILSWTLMKQYRLEAGLTVDQLARSAKVSEAILVKWENGGLSSGTPGVVQRVARFFGIQTTDMNDQLNAVAAPSAAKLTATSSDLQLASAEAEKADPTRLNQREEEIIFRHYGQDEMYKDIAEDLKVSKQRVHQIDQRAQQKLALTMMQDEFRYLAECQKSVIETQRQTIVLQHRMIDTLTANHEKEA